MPNHRLTQEKLLSNFWNRVSILGEGDCWEWIGSVGKINGYGGFSIGGGVKVLAHRFSYELKFGKIPKGQCVLHRCDNKVCVNPKHFFLGTKTENNRDRDKKGRQARGEKTNTCVLTEEEVFTIRNLRGIVEQKDLALYFEVDLSTIQRILYGQTWKHLIPVHAVQA